MAARLAIRQVEGLVSKGELVALVLEIEAEGISFVLLSVQGKKKKPNLIREIHPGTSRLLLDREVVDAAQCLCGQDLTVKVSCLADSSIADQWIGRLVCREMEEAPPPEEEEREKRETEEVPKEKRAEVASLEKEEEEISVFEKPQRAETEPLGLPQGTVSEREKEADSSKGGEFAEVRQEEEGWGSTYKAVVPAVVESEGRGEVAPRESLEETVAARERELPEWAMAETYDRDTRPVETEGTGGEISQDPPAGPEATEDLTRGEAGSISDEEEAGSTLPHLEITEVHCLAQKGEVAEILVEGKAWGCKSIFLKVEWGKVKYFQVLFPSQGRFNASFDRRIFPPTPVDEVNSLSVTVLSLADSGVSDSWRARPRWSEKKLVTGAAPEREGRGGETKDLSERILSNKTAAKTGRKGDEERTEGAETSSILPVVVISEVTGIVSQGRVQEIVVKGDSQGCPSLFLRLELEGVKFFQRIKVPAGTFQASFDHEMIQNRPQEGFDDVRITAVSLTQPAVSDLWQGKITWIEKEGGPNR